ncbi:MAG: tyrosine-type recombinase/integrase [Proteobacteria bacterium]|nr:tyrosine-type recombinase/integrase [Pseudomonadota bacterium]
MRSDDIDRFLAKLELVHKSRYSYVTPLRAFRAFAQAHTRSGETLSIRTVRAWLIRDAARSPFANVVSRAGIIVRYLDWRARGDAAAHPLAALKKEYGGHLMSIVRALLQEDYKAALERLRPLPAWGSVLGLLMREHIARMRSLGYRYETRSRELRRFDRFLQRRPDLSRAPLRALIEAWQSSNRGLRHRLIAQRCGRVLSQAMRRRDETIPIIAIEAGLTRRVVQEQRRPHVYTQVEIARLFEAAHTFHGRGTPLRALMTYTMLSLAYCAGLRIGEIAALRLRDVDIERGSLEIRETKFFKTRRLPLAPSVVAVLSRYLRARQTIGAPNGPDAPLWWSPLRRKGYAYGGIEKLLVRVIRRAGLKPDGGYQGPRVHDLRHAFVAHRMLQWYREGVEPQSRLPHLATYLGHKDIVSTLAYLNITPELLHQASERYRHRGAQALGAAGGRP